MTDLPAAAKRVEAAALAIGLTIEIRTMPASTRTAAEAAAAVQASVGQIVKSLLFKGKIRASHTSSWSPAPIA
jgi:prolyl-tRNA editing enzyme YbaK/EbsC (Cys-tRNA(Pro) deacylase)